MNSLCYFRRKRFSAILRWNRFKFCVLLSILGVIVVFIYSRNHVRDTGGCLSPFCVQSSSLTKNSPLCFGNLLDKREYRYAKGAGGSYDYSRMISKLGSCHLLNYNFERTVGCFDALYQRLYSFAFCIHRRFKNSATVFLFPQGRPYPFIPEYDRISQPNPLSPTNHDRVEITSGILRLRLSFQWRPILNDTVIETIRHWATDGQTNRPHFIIIGIALWHMLQSEGADFKLYQKKLKELAPFLVQLAKVTQVIWLNQFPVVEKYSNTNTMNTDIFSEKIHHYNEAVLSELQNYPEMRIIWDSSNFLVEEYIRSCVMFFGRAQYSSFYITDPDHMYTVTISRTRVIRLYRKPLNSCSIKFATNS